MSFRTIALTVLASVSLSAMTFAAEPEEASQPISDPAADQQPAPTAETTKAAEDTETKANAQEPSEMSTEEASAAAGNIEQPQVEKINPHDATAAEIAAYNATAAPDDRIICRKEQLTGSHRRVKVCMTVAQKRYLTETTQRELATSGRNASGPPGN